MLFESVLRVGAPRSIRGVDDVTAREVLLARRGEEGVDVRLLYAVPLLVELALDRAVALFLPELCYELDAHVETIEALNVCPLSVRPSVLKLLGHLRVGLQKLGTEPLEVGVLLAFGFGSLKIAAQQICRLVRTSGDQSEIEEVYDVPA